MFIQNMFTILFIALLYYEFTFIYIAGGGGVFDYVIAGGG